MGSRWKIPTYMQSYEMMSGTNSTWTTINGVNGYKFTSKTDSSKYIFLPAGGYWSETTLSVATQYGYYNYDKLSSSTTQPLFAFEINGTSLYVSGRRWNGFSVRAIQ